MNRTADALIERIAGRLFRSPGRPFAFILDGENVFFRVGEIQEGTPRSPAVDLIQGIYDQFGGEARRILRRRIFLSYVPTEMCRAMIKVAAKRVQVITLTAAENPPSNLTWVPIPSPASISMVATSAAHSRPGPEPVREGPPGTTGPTGDIHLKFVNHCLKLRDQVPIVQPRHASDRPVAALLVSRENEVLARAINSNHLNKTRHAEVNLIQSYVTEHGAFLPAGSRIYTTLKPCRMCAAMIRHCCSAENPVPVYYIDHDPGPWAKGTCLDGTSWLRQIPGGSP